ncbi:MAG TPA: periplasmic heavy metal sensor [Polyangiaceae bacterium]|nr:periplasmic heavy metal sensor [Polyangiaceae bacterium]
MKRFRWSMVPAMLLACGPALGAPPPGAPPRAAPPQAAPAQAGPMQQRMLRVRSRVLREKVGLTDDKATEVEAILDRYAPERRRISLKIRDGRQKLKALMVLNSEDQNAYKGALDEVRTNRVALQGLMERAFNEIAAQLTPKEQGRLFLALDDLRLKAGQRRRLRNGPAMEEDDDG